MVFAGTCSAGRRLAFDRGDRLGGKEQGPRNTAGASFILSMFGAILREAR